MVGTQFPPKVFFIFLQLFDPGVYQLGTMVQELDHAGRRRALPSGESRFETLGGPLFVATLAYLGCGLQRRIHLLVHGHSEGFHFLSFLGGRIEGSDPPRHVPRGEAGEGQFEVLVETRGPGKQGGSRDGDQHTGDPWVHLLEDEHDGEGQGGHAHGWPMRGSRDFLKNSVHGLVVVMGLLHLHAQNTGELGGRDDQGGCIGESIDHRVREEVDHEPQAKNTEQKLEQAHQESEQDRVGDVLLASRSSHGFKNCGGHQRHHRHGSRCKLPAGSKEGGDGRRQKSRVEAVVGWKPRELGVRHGLRDQDEGHGEAGKQVGPQGIAPAFPYPPKKGKHAVQDRNGLGPFRVGGVLHGLACRRTRLGHQPLSLRRPLQLVHEQSEGDRLVQDVQSPQLDCFPALFGGCMRGQNDNLVERVESQDAAEGFDSIHPGHGQIQEDGIEFRARGLCDGFGPTRSGLDNPPACFDAIGEGFQKVRLIIDQEDSKLLVSHAVSVWAVGQRHAGKVISKQGRSPRPSYRRLAPSSATRRSRRSCRLSEAGPAATGAVPCKRRMGRRLSTRTSS